MIGKNGKIDPKRKQEMMKSMVSVKKLGHEERSFPIIKRASPVMEKFVNLDQNSNNGNYDLKMFSNPFRA